ncbi:hypothetical protein QJS04_geneDACA013185 [Acorus gramineus]|uniref:Uncharacterized protein n=1 Tax=Acorus gramineus TaxID=55184 RepID=A0AAV9B8K9_ACOGR|nr:hypothetical protein QJS04_geneDACA013185 [Acorus gramineus]
MDLPEEDHHHRRNPNGNGLYKLLMNGPDSAFFEIRLFYVRLSPCAADSAPAHLALTLLRRESGGAVPLEINGRRVPAAEPASLSLRRDRLGGARGEATYVSTDGVRVGGAVDFEVHDEHDELVLCGSLERMELPWSDGAVGPDKDPRTGWSLDCCCAAGGGGSRAGKSQPSIEVYIAGCCAASPLILTQTVNANARKNGRQGTLDVILEDEETSGKDNGNVGVHRRTPWMVGDGETYECDSEIKLGRGYHPEGIYPDDEDGELSWFNAGVRVGVGIGLGMCLGIGIGVGVLMRSYQATTRTFRRRFL